MRPVIAFVFLIVYLVLTWNLGSLFAANWLVEQTDTVVRFLIVWGAMVSAGGLVFSLMCVSGALLLLVLASVLALWGVTGK